MTDRELLELVAKAQGWFDYPTDSIEQGNYWHTDREKAPFDPCFPKEYWNPFADDGDALRLAVKIYMFDGSLFDLFLKFRLEEVRVDGSRSDEEIVRRAIVRAAAEIGRNMK